MIPCQWRGVSCALLVFALVTSGCLAGCGDDAAPAESAPDAETGRDGGGDTGLDLAGPDAGVDVAGDPGLEVGADGSPDMAPDRGPDGSDLALDSDAEADAPIEPVVLPRFQITLTSGGGSTSSEDHRASVAVGGFATHRAAGTDHIVTVRALPLTGVDQ